jgi:hypothetical protein
MYVVYAGQRADEGSVYTRANSRLMRQTTTMVRLMGARKLPAAGSRARPRVPTISSSRALLNTTMTDAEVAGNQVFGTQEYRTLVHEVRTHFLRRRVPSNTHSQLTPTCRQSVEHAPRPHRHTHGRPGSRLPASVQLRTIAALSSLVQQRRLCLPLHAAGICTTRASMIPLILPRSSASNGRVQEQIIPARREAGNIQAHARQALAVVLSARDTAKGRAKLPEQAVPSRRRCCSPTQSPCPWLVQLSKHGAQGN